MLPTNRDVFSNVSIIFFESILLLIFLCRLNHLTTNNFYANIAIA
ncbi:hypothetical protein CWATWH8502_981 [Crocosphaera watsonii WH 8502]|uniref:Uncharacterized protein n=1 Tax=Crocosphaera watsonii WH 8502 TaxID=423474 RepID=T2I735_CROWT|nr:hypothetical protein CWATWH8502_981 [Crocosphaera watsonii WH 8502]